jgi:hypothetical protein
MQSLVLSKTAQPRSIEGLQTTIQRVDIVLAKLAVN